MKIEHPEFYNNPVKCGKSEMCHFKNLQESGWTKGRKFVVEV